MRKYFVSLFLYSFFLIIFVSVLFADETLIITTYYPSPYGVYNQLTTTGNTYLATTSGSVGIGTISPSGKLEVAGDIVAHSNAAGNCEWVAVYTGSAYICPAGKFVAGTRDLTADGFPDGIYCCEL